MSKLVEELKRLRALGQKLIQDNECKSEAEREVFENWNKSTYEVFSKISEKLKSLAFSRPGDDSLSFGFDITSTHICKKYDLEYSRVSNLGKAHDWDLHNVIFSRSILRSLLLENEINCEFYIDETYHGSCVITADMKTLTMDDAQSQKTKDYPN